MRENLQNVAASQGSMQRRRQRLVACTLLLFLSGWCAQAQQQSEADQSQQYVATMLTYIDLTEKLVDLSRRPETAVFQAVEGVVEVYQQRGEVALAIDYLNEVLEDVENPAVRNILHLKLRELYQATGQGQKALEQLKQMVKENVRRAD